MWRRRFPSAGLILILFGGWIWLTNLEAISFDWGRDWPVILIILGLYELIEGIWGHRKRRWWMGEGWRFNFTSPSGDKKERDEIRKVLADLSEGKVKVEEAEERIRDIREE